ncbi:MAG TPA: YetF domain-containing protein [Pyrinomonadaceae bacterium]|jgi:uncharacterized membrane protein YcaP (DUF421 family)
MIVLLNLLLGIDWYEKLLKVDWDSVFSTKESLLEIFIRGSIMYLVMFALLRIFRRQAGSVGIADLLVIVVIADAAQNGMAGDSKSVTEAVLLIVTIVLWDYVFDLLGYKSKFFERIFQPKALHVVKDGQLMRQNMKSEMITYDELLSAMRQQGIADLAEVKQACLESDGHFSFIKKDGGEVQSNPKKK